MTIKTVDTYHLWFAETVVNLDTIHDRDRTNLPFVQSDNYTEFLQSCVTAGSLPSTRQPEDSVVRTETEIIITTVWLDKAVAEQRCILKQNTPFGDSISSPLISSVVIED
jgi:hypothetical protein